MISIEFKTKDNKYGDINIWDDCTITMGFDADIKFKEIESDGRKLKQLHSADVVIEATGGKRSIIKSINTAIRKHYKIGTSQLQVQAFYIE